MMRYAPQHNEMTRERVLKAATHRLQRDGIAAVGLAKIMSDVELTVGTFYTHFASKEALVQEVIARALQERHASLTAASQAGDLESVIRAYLCAAHRDAPGDGCPVAALAPEIARHADPTRAAMSSGLEPSLDDIAVLLTTARGEPASRADAAALFGLLSGVLQLARATPDLAESDAILDAGIRAALRLAR